MQIVVKDFIEKISADNYQKVKFTFGDQQLTKLSFTQICQQMWENLCKNLANNQLTQVEVLLEYSHIQVTLKLETSIINLPFENINRVDNFYNDLNSKVMLNVYLIVQAETLNASGLRIELICDSQEALNAQLPTKFVDEVTKLVEHSLND